MSHIRLEWHEDCLPDRLPVTQIYGFCFDSRGHILLIDDGDQYSLPGGKPEEDETWEQTMRREVLEEAQITLGEIYYLGWQEVIGDRLAHDERPYAQVRMIAQVESLLPVAADPATGICYRRGFHAPDDADRSLDWDQTGLIQIQAALRLAGVKWGVRHGE